MLNKKAKKTIVIRQCLVIFPDELQHQHLLHFAFDTVQIDGNNIFIYHIVFAVPIIVIIGIIAFFFLVLR